MCEEVCASSLLLCVEAFLCFFVDRALRTYARTNIFVYFLTKTLTYLNIYANMILGEGWVILAKKAYYKNLYKGVI